MSNWHDTNYTWEDPFPQVRSGAPWEGTWLHGWGCVFWALSSIGLWVFIGHTVMVSCFYLLCLIFETCFHVSHARLELLHRWGRSWIILLTHSKSAGVTGMHHSARSLHCQGWKPGPRAYQTGLLFTELQTPVFAELYSDWLLPVWSPPHQNCFAIWDSCGSIGASGLIFPHFYGKCYGDFCRNHHWLVGCLG